MPEHGPSKAPPAPRTRGLRIPIFVSLLAANVALVGLAVAILVFVSVREFRVDKETYVFDYASQVAEGLAQQVGATLDAEKGKLELLATVTVDAGRTDAQRRELVESMIAHFPEVARFEVVADGQAPVRLYNRALLRKVGFASSEEYDSKRNEPKTSRETAKSGALAVAPLVFSEDSVGLNLVFELKASGDARSVLVSGDVVEPALTLPFLEPGAAETFLVDAKGRVILHRDREALKSGRDLSGSAVVQQALAKTTAGSSTVSEEGKGWLAAWAPVSAANLRVISRVDEAQAYAAARAVVQKSLAAGGALLVLMTFAGFVVARRFSSPLVRMVKATERIAKGDFAVQVPVDRRNEIGDLAISLNRMSAELLARENQIKQQQEALVQSEKMAAFGALGAGIAHEVKNPLAGILGFSELAMRKVDAQHPVMRYLQMIEKETRRCTDIVQNLLKFARREKVEYQATDLNQVIADTYKLVHHQLGLKKVQIDVGLTPDLPPINGNANQLQQVLLNLAINAGDAMPNGGKVTLSSSVRGGEVIVTCTDNGTGMPEEVRRKIFDPFFTTKEPGKGTGLGLSVSYGIVKDHAGTITVDSVVGKGTTFTITFPALGAAQARGAA